MLSVAYPGLCLKEYRLIVRAADTWRASAGVALSDEGPSASGSARLRLSNPAIEAAGAAGKAMPFAQVVAYALEELPDD
jgi:hypothetical protein